MLLPDPEDQLSAEQTTSSATSRESVERLIAQHLPAHVQYELRFVPSGPASGGPPATP